MDALVLWWYSWGVLLFLFVDIVMIAWLTYDSQVRGARAIGWQLAAALAALLILPSLILTFSNVLTQIGMAAQIVPFFYLGLIGSIASIIISVAGLVFIRQMPAFVPERVPAPPPEIRQPPLPVPRRQRINAWLVDRSGNRNYQLFEGDTRLGRNGQNDIVIRERTVAREHILIRQDGIHFTLYDRGSRTGTLVNDRRVETPVLLQHGDRILLGDVELEFVTAL